LGDLGGQDLYHSLKYLVLEASPESSTFELLPVLMLLPLFVRPLSELEQTTLEQGLRSKDAF
jgi:hypothetical protein